MEDDERFAHIAKDPRFKKIPAEKRKIKIDQRFRQMFTDEDFNTKYFVDKRGRKVKESAKEDLSNFYQLSDEEKVEHSDEELETRTRDEPLKNVKEKKRRKGGKAKRETKRQEGSRKEMIDENENGVEENIDEKPVTDSSMDIWQSLGEDAPITEEATCRLAVCNMDWDKITADDLFVLFHSFLPTGKSIISVKIYPSEYGVERMTREDELGPTELVSNNNEVDAVETSNKDIKEYDQEQLRQYQLNRLRYYYAVVECDSPGTAEAVYEECDGMEYEGSSSHIDLRFIPEDMSFESEPVSQTLSLPSSDTYKPSEFITTALQQSSVKLTWDESDPKRVQTTMRNFSKDDLLDMDFNAYLASSSSSENEDDDDGGENKKENEDTKIEKYKELLEEIQSKDHESENEMDVSWEVGLKETAEELVKKRRSENDQRKMTPWENYLNEKKNKKKNKKKLKEESKDELQMSDDELPADVDLTDPFFAEELDNSNRKTKSANKNRKGVGRETEEEKRQKAELQLLMMDDDDGKKHFNLKSIMKNEKTKKRKNKRKPPEETKEDNFEIDVNDSRFSALYSSHHFAVDPSDPQFKKTKAMDSIIREKQRRSDLKQETTSKPDEISSGEKRQKIDSSLSLLVKNVKSNAIKYQDRKKRKK